jgi:DNA-directed RNA polymerase specialized sigma24 family protein
VEKIKQGEPKDCTRLAPYVLSICQHKALEFLRRNSREKFSEVDWNLLPGNGKTPDQLWASEDQSARVRAVLESLSPKDRRILLEVFHEQVDRDLLCKKYDTSRDQLKMILFRARQRFQKKWEEN